MQGGEEGLVSAGKAGSHWEPHASFPPALAQWLRARSLLSRLLETSGEGQIQSRLQGWVILLHTGSGEVNSHANRGINLDDSCT